MIGLLVVLGIITIIAGIVWGVSQVYSGDGERRKQAGHLKGPVILFLIGLLWTMVIASGSAHIPGTHVGVIENKWTGQFSALSPGTHIWPFQPRLIPFVTEVTKYDLRRQIVEIGTPDPPSKDSRPFIKTAVEADSNSPGRPAVYFHARGWAYPNKDLIVELHKRYGPDYLHTWMERVWVATLKSVQGQNIYSYVGQHRTDFQNDVEHRLQSQLLDNDGNPIVFVSQLAVVNFEFTDATKQYLQTVQKVEFDRQQAELLEQVNTKQQVAQKIAADTVYIVEVRNAERDRDAAIARANGQAESVKIAANAEKYRIDQIYTAESEGIKKVQTVLSQAPQGYLEYQKTKQWDGKLPQYMLGNGVVSFVDITPSPQKPVTSAYTAPTPTPAPVPIK